MALALIIRGQALIGSDKNQRNIVFQRWHQKTCFLTPLSSNHLFFYHYQILQVLIVAVAVIPPKTLLERLT